MSRVNYTLRAGLACGLGVAIAAACSTGNDQVTISPGSDDAGGGSSDAPVAKPDGAAADTGVPCTGLGCAVAACAPGKETTLTGTVFAPNGKTPIYDAIVYVPNGTVPKLPDGVVCDQCGTPPPGSPIVTGLTKSDGTFELQNVPAGADIPLVVQIGKWRRQTKVSSVPKCETTAVLPDATRLPKNRTEGDMPQIALTAGGCDAIGCVLKKLGIDDAEFGTNAQPERAVHVFKGGNATGTWPDAQILWKDLNLMKKYDQIVLSCECQENLANKGAVGMDAFKAMTDYMAAGGRILTTDFMYTWYKDSSDPDLVSAGTIPGAAPVQMGGSSVKIDTSFPKGQALSESLSLGFPAIVKDTPKLDVVFGNVTSMDTNKARVWAKDPGNTNNPRLFTLNLPAGKTTMQQCGKAVHIDGHTNNSDMVGAGFPATGCATPMKEGEGLVAFFLFDGVSCIQRDGDPPVKPPLK